MRPTIGSRSVPLPRMIHRLHLRLVVDQRYLRPLQKAPALTPGDETNHGVPIIHRRQNNRVTPGFSGIRYSRPSQKRARAHNAYIVTLAAASITAAKPFLASLALTVRINIPILYQLYRLCLICGCLLESVRWPIGHDKRGGASASPGGALVGGLDAAHWPVRWEIAGKRTPNGAAGGLALWSAPSMLRTPNGAAAGLALWSAPSMLLKHSRMRPQSA